MRWDEWDLNVTEWKHKCLRVTNKRAQGGTIRRKTSAFSLKFVCLYCCWHCYWCIYNLNSMQCNAMEKQINMKTKMKLKTKQNQLNWNNNKHTNFYLTVPVGRHNDLVLHLSLTLAICVYRVLMTERERRYVKRRPAKCFRRSFRFCFQFLHLYFIVCNSFHKANLFRGMFSKREGV